MNSLKFPFDTFIIKDKILFRYPLKIIGLIPLQKHKIVTFQGWYKKTNPGFIGFKNLSKP